MLYMICSYLICTFIVWKDDQPNIFKGCIGFGLTELDNFPVDDFSTGVFRHPVVTYNPPSKHAIQSYTVLDR